jgi:hypothetical protein
MSRVSRKSELSPSITRGSGGIDLGKNSGVDTGRKSEPSLTSGGIGITQEVTNVGGMSVSVGGNIDITPVDFGINIDPSEGTISVATGAEIPGGLLGISGGIEVDLNTGEVIGGSIGGEVGGLGINVSNSQKGGIGIEFTVQIPGTPIELSLGFGFPPKKPPSTSTPPPGGTPSFTMPTLDSNCYYDFFILGLDQDKKFEDCIGYTSSESGQGWSFKKGNIPAGESNAKFGEPVWDFSKQRYNPVVTGKKQVIGIVEVRQLGYPRSVIEGDVIKGSVGTNTTVWDSVKIGGNITVPFVGGVGSNDTYRNVKGDYAMQVIPEMLKSWPYKLYWDVEIQFLAKCPEDDKPELVNFDPSNSENNSPSFPNPPPRKQKKMDDCCRQNLAFLRLIYTKLGLAQFPGQLPNTIIQEVPKEGEEPAEPPQVPIPDLVSLLNWTFERDDERWGQWEVQINVKDSDITQEGDQGKQIKFPNLAESIAEIEGQILSLTANVDALVAITTKNLVESGLGRQEAIKSYLAAKSIIKYMAFKTTEIDVDIPACFTPEAQTIHELVNESTIHFKGIDYTEKETLRDIYLDLLQAAAIIRAVHWQRIDTKQDTKGQILAQLRGIAGLASSVKNPTPAGETQPKHTENFEDFIDTVEDGFRNVTGVADPENPYNRTPDRRPRIRQIGENISQAGGKS